MCLVKWFVGWVFLQILWLILSYAKPGESQVLFLVKSLGKNWAVFIGVSQMSKDCNLVNYDVYIYMYIYYLQ